jgi:hypothetical protein
MRAAVYTCVTNNYDYIAAPAVITNEVDYLCFSDGSVTAPTPWENIRIDDAYSGKDANRYIKIMPHLNPRLSNYDLTIYVDGVIDVIGDLTPLIKTIEKASGNLFMYKHPLRNCVYLEARSCVESMKVSIKAISKLIRQFKMDGLPENFGLFEGGVIIRKSSSEVKKLMEVWWSIYLSGVKRDQLGLIYAIWTTGLEVHSLGTPDHRQNQIYFRCRSGHTGDFIRRYFAWFIWRPVIGFMIDIKLLRL